MKKFLAGVALLIFALCLAPGIAKCESFTCRVENATDFLAKVTLVMAPNNSTYNLTIGAHQSYNIPTGDFYRARGLKGKLIYSIFDKDITPVCTANGVEGSADSCPDDPRNSSWKIQISGEAAHFVQQ